MICKNCKSECVREEADVDVGIIYGPWFCNNCGWSQESESDICDRIFKNEE